MAPHTTALRHSPPHTHPEFTAKQQTHDRRSWPNNSSPNREMGDNRTASPLCSDGTSLASRRIEADDIERMNREDRRLETFKSWPASAPIEANKLAKAGFFYTGDGYKVKCFSCAGTVDDWDFGDQAIQKHSSLNPVCAFVQQKSDNVPLNGYRSLPPINSTYNSASSSSSSNIHSVQTIRPSSQSQQTTSTPTPTCTPTPNSSSSAPQSAATSSEKTWESFSRLLSEEERLKTFKGWPSVFVNPADLAKAGFFYLRETDKVQCIFCHGIVGDWEVGDIPITEHHRHFPRCPFVKGYNVHNIPKVDENNPAPNPPPDDTWGGDVTGAYNYEMEMLSRPEKGHMTSKKLSCLGINEHTAPRHPCYSSYEARMRTYESWPTSIPQKPETLAEAGFYYAGISDHVRCFCCDGGLRNWETHDEPWVEHARWFGKCCFLTLMKGHEFVAESKIQRPPVLPQRNPKDKITVGRQVSSAELDILLNTPIVRTVIDMGFEVELIRHVLRKQLELTGATFPDADSLATACMDFQHNVERRSSLNIPSTSTTEKPIELPRSSTLSSLKSPDDLSIEDENRMLKEMRICKICMDEEIGVVFLPCGHLLSCPKCAPSLKDCPLCRKEIRGTVRTFLS